MSSVRSTVAVAIPSLGRGGAPTCISAKTARPAIRNATQRNLAQPTQSTTDRLLVGKYAKKKYFAREHYAPYALVTTALRCTSLHRAELYEIVYLP